MSTLNIKCEANSTNQKTTFTITNNIFNVIKTQWQIYLNSDRNSPIANITTPNQRSDTNLLNATNTLLKYSLSNNTDYVIRIRAFNGTSWTNWTEFVNFRSTNLSAKLSRLDFPLRSNLISTVDFPSEELPESFSIDVSGDTSVYEGSERTFTFSNDSGDIGSTWVIISQPDNGTVVLNAAAGISVTGLYTPTRDFEGSDSFQVSCTTNLGVLTSVINTTVVALETWPNANIRIDETDTNENFVELNSWQLCGAKCYYAPPFSLSKSVRTDTVIPDADPEISYRIVVGVNASNPSNGYLNFNANGKFGMYCSGWDLLLNSVLVTYPPNALLYENHPELVDSPFESTGTVNRFYAKFATEEDRETLATTIYNHFVTNINQIKSHLSGTQLTKYNNGLKSVIIDNIRHPDSGHRNGSPIVSSPDIFDRTDWAYTEIVPWVNVCDYLVRLRKKIHSLNLKILVNAAFSFTYNQPPYDTTNLADIRALTNAVDGVSLESSFHPLFRRDINNTANELNLLREFLDYNSVGSSKRTILFLPQSYPFIKYNLSLSGQGTGSFSGTYKYCFIGNTTTSSNAVGYHSKIISNSITVSNKASVRIGGWPTSGGKVNIYRTTNGGSVYKLVASNIDVALNSFYDDNKTDINLGENMPIWDSTVGSPDTDEYRFWEEFLAAAMSMMIWKPNDSIFVGRTINSYSDINIPLWYNLPSIYSAPDDDYQVFSISPLILSRSFNSGTKNITIDLFAASRIVATTGITTTYKTAITLV